ncbi:MAG: hypothetical protein ACYC41_11940 [Bacillota bacterium]
MALRGIRIKHSRHDARPPNRHKGSDFCMVRCALARKLLIVLLIVALAAAAGAGCTTPKPTPAKDDTSAASGGTSGGTTGGSSGGTSGGSGGTTTGGQTAKPPTISVFPSTATVDLGRPILLLRANANSQAVDTKTYAARWTLGDALLSTETSLTEAPFIKAIGNREGTYEVTLIIINKSSGKEVGRSTAKVVAKKDKPIIVATNNHYVSTAAGKGMRYWTAWSDGAEWWEGDADLQFKGATGTLTFTIQSAAVQIPEESRWIGSQVVFAFTDWKDDGTQASFTYTSVRGQVYKFGFVHEANGRLKGTMVAPQMEVQGAILPGMGGLLDLKSAP